MGTSGAADVVIVGGGLAGLVAGARASELGCRVVVLEAGSGNHYPCNSRYAGGVFHVGFTDIVSPPAELTAAIERACGTVGDWPQARAIADHAGRVVSWMRAQGCEFGRTAVAWQSHVLAPSRAIVAGQDWRNRGPDVALNRLSDRIRSRGGRIVDNTRASALLMEGGRCVGVEASAGGQVKRFPAQAVVLADGGFQANLEMLGQHVTRRPAALKQRGGASGLGDGIRMAMAVGAAVSRLDRFYGHLLSRDALTNDNVWPYPELDALATHGILVDALGRRFVNEGIGGVPLANALAALDDPLSATIVFDAAIWEGPGRSARIPANPALADAGGTIHRAGSLRELARLAGLDRASLEITVATYNSMVANAQLNTIIPARSTGRFPALPIVTAPFMAIPVCAGITYTMGGLRIDGSSRVLDTAGRAIAGLYAAGSTTGGLEGGDRSAYVGGLAKAGVQGLLAAEHIATATA